MSTQTLLIGPGELGDYLQQQLHHAAQELRLDLQQASDIEAALEGLKKKAAAGAPPLLILLGPHLKKPVVTAREIHRISPLSYLVFMANADRAAELRPAVSPISMIGSDWSIARLASDDLAGVLRNAARSARQRQQLRTTLDRINVQLASKPPAGAEGQRRHVTSYRFLASILGNATDAIIATDNQGTITTWNRVAERLFNVKDRHAIGQPIHAIAAGPWAEQLPGLIAQLGAGRPLDSTHELQCNRLDGTILEAELVMTSVREESGHQIGISAIVRDITERKRAAEAVRESQRRLQSVIDNSMAVIYVKDLQGRYLLINRRFEELFHVTREGIMGKTAYDLFPKEQADAFLAAQAAGGAVESEEVAPQDDGLHTYISIKAPLQGEGGHPYATCGISTDITERKRDEAALRQSEERIRLIVKSSLDAMVTINEQGRVTEWNPQAEAIFGWQRAEMIGRVMADFIIPDHSRDAMPSTVASPGASRARTLIESLVGIMFRN